MVASGFDPFDPTSKEKYGFGRYVADIFEEEKSNNLVIRADDTLLGLDTVAQAKVAASSALEVVSHHVLQLSPLVSEVEERLCRGCERCEEICENRAIELSEIRPGILASHINEVL